MTVEQIINWIVIYSFAAAIGFAVLWVVIYTSVKSALYNHSRESASEVADLIIRAKE